MTDPDSANIRGVVAALTAFCLGVMGWKLTHAVMNHVVHTAVANHALTHLSALVVAGGFMSAGAGAAIKGSTSPRSMNLALRNPCLIRTFGTLSLTGFFLTSIADQLDSADHELHPVLLLILGATVEAGIGVTTSAVWRSCARTLRQWVQWLVTPGHASAVTAPVVEPAPTRVRPTLWSSIIPRRGPPHPVPLA